MRCSIPPELAIDGAALKPIHAQPILERLQLGPRAVDILVLLYNGQDPLGNMGDGEVLTQREEGLWPHNLRVVLPVRHQYS